jgi:hypothetical protein
MSAGRLEGCTFGCERTDGPELRFGSGTLFSREGVRFRRGCGATVPSGSLRTA